MTGFRAKDYGRGHIEAEGQPEVVELTDNGRRRVMLRFELGNVEFKLTLTNPEQLERAIQSARIWVNEG